MKRLSFILGALLFAGVACRPAQTQSNVKDDETVAAPEAQSVDPRRSFEEMDRARAESIVRPNDPGIERLGCVCARSQADATLWDLHAYYVYRDRGYKIRVREPLPFKDCLAQKTATEATTCVL